ncbi:hypothetical protein HZB94_04205 [Candidatus Falkowbacteria bacterium]|nr:hypothetical protein [Candidatus Falkowbacteria bacterium]
MKPDPDKWYIGPNDESFEYYHALTLAIGAAKNAGFIETDREMKTLRRLQRQYQESSVRAFYENQDLDPTNYGLPSIEKVQSRFGKEEITWSEVVDWALEHWNKKKAFAACWIPGLLED